MQYANVLGEGRDLVALASGSHSPRFREREVRSSADAITGGRSVLLVGPAGAGKTAVLSAVACQLAELGFAVRQFTTAQILAGTRYIGDWQSKLACLMAEAAQANAVLNIVDVANLPTAGVSSGSNANFLDAMRPQMSSGRVLIISEATLDQLQSVHRVADFAALFDLVRVDPLSAEQMREVVQGAAKDIGLALDKGSLKRLLQLCAAFGPAHVGPGAAIDLLHKVKDYRDQKSSIGEDAEQTPAFVEKVFSIHSGLPLFVISSAAVKSTREIRDWFRQRLIGQEAAIDAVVEMVALYKSRLHDQAKPIGSFLFVGPTGVGKTELARALATFFFGSERRMLRFDMSEFADYNAFEMLVGTPDAPERPARLIDPIRAQPFQVVLFDELEKGHRTIQDLLLQVLDEGRLTTPGGETLSFRSTIIIATTNVGASEARTSSIGFGRQPEPGYDPDGVMRSIETQFRPEFINRFQHLVLFHPLTQEQAAQIVRMELRAVLKREGITDRNLIIDVGEDAIGQIISKGFNDRYGARAIKREVHRQVVVPIATLLIEREVIPGSLLSVGVRDGRTRVVVSHTPESRSIRAQREPIRTAKGERLTRKEIATRITAASEVARRLVRDTESDRLRQEIADIDANRKEHQFWHDAGQAARALARQARLLHFVSRVDRLSEWAEELASASDAQPSRTQLNDLADRL